jgi:uncharacterized membrane protein YgcG
VPPRGHLTRAPNGRLVLLLAVVAALTLAGCGGGKSYSFPEVRIDATVNQDGSLSIEEHRTFDFDGDFSFAFFTIEHKHFSDVVDFQLSEGGDVYEEGIEVPGHVRIEDSVLEGPGGFKFKATWWFDAHDEQRTWTFRYRMLCAVDLYADTAHLLWKFIGEGWTVPTDRAVITVHLPGRADEVPEPRPSSCNPSSIVAQGVPPIPELFQEPLEERDTRAWGHGPLQGEVIRVDPQTIQLVIEDLPPETFVEGSITFPPEAVPVMAQVPVDALSGILAEEAALAAAANADRIAARREAARQERWRWYGWGFLIGFPILVLLMALITRMREAVPGIPRRLPDPPEEAIRPARLALEWALYRRGSGTENAFRAQLLEMARRRFIEIRPIGLVSEAKDYEIVFRARPPDDLDATFVDGLFPDATPIRTESFSPTTKQLKKLGDWWDDIFKAARGTGAVRFRKSSLLFWIVALSALYWSIPLAIYSGLPWFYPILVQVVGIAAPLVYRRIVPARYAAPERTERMQRWWAFRRYLEDFSTLTDAPTAAIVIWERYLGFAVALGIADRVEEQVRAIVPEGQLRSPWAASGASLRPPPALSSVIHGLTTRSMSHSTTFAPASSSGGGSSSSFSSSSGSSSGGFSSGGGGGGGGTGGGAG